MVGMEVGGFAFLYGTMFAQGGLVAAGKTYNNCVAIRRAVDFLLNTQCDDGGWDGSFLSCPNKVICIYLFIYFNDTSLLYLVMIILL